MSARLAAASILVTVAAAAAAAAAASPGPGRYLSTAPSGRSVRLTLLAGLGGANGGFNFDGYGRGELLVRIPIGWRVVVDCQNRGVERHSCAVVHGALATAPAFPGAATRHPVTGLSPGSKAQFTFTASRVGTFRIASLVPGQEQARMYAVLDVTRGGRPSIEARPGP